MIEEGQVSPSDGHSNTTFGLHGKHLHVSQWPLALVSAFVALPTPAPDERAFEDDDHNSLELGPIAEA